MTAWKIKHDEISAFSLKVIYSLVRAAVFFSRCTHLHTHVRKVIFDIFQFFFYKVVIFTSICLNLRSCAAASAAMSTWLKKYTLNATKMGHIHPNKMIWIHKMYYINFYLSIALSWFKVIEVNKNYNSNWHQLFFFYNILRNLHQYCIWLVECSVNNILALILRGNY